ncbi:hypothetical protein [Gordonia aichiensis]|uniref:hypothetical protein n=1 Tax=Gordonia aichiensis TaxID=36820 RepID=UPI0032661692
MIATMNVPTATSAVQSDVGAITPTGSARTIGVWPSATLHPVWTPRCGATNTAAVTISSIGTDSITGHDTTGRPLAAIDRNAATTTAVADKVEEAMTPAVWGNRRRPRTMAAPMRTSTSQTTATPTPAFAHITFRIAIAKSTLAALFQLVASSARRVRLPRCPTASHTRGAVAMTGMYWPF